MTTRDRLSAGTPHRAARGDPRARFAVLLAATRLAAALLIGSALASSLPLLAGEARAAIRTFSLSAHGSLALAVPTGWKDSVNQPPGELPPTIIFSPKEGDAFQVLVTPIWPLAGREPMTPEKVKVLVEGQGREMLKESVETTLAIKEISGPTARGYLFSLTDKSIVGKPVEKGQYLHMTQGIIQVDDLAMTATILSHDRDSAEVRAAVEMLRSATRTK